MVERLAAALGTLARVMRGRAIDDWTPFFSLSEVIAVEEAAIAGDRLLHVLDRSRQSEEEREQEEEARCENCRAAVRKFLGWSEFLQKLSADEEVDLIWAAQEFYRQLRRRRGETTVLLPFVGLLPSERRQPWQALGREPGEYRVSDAVRLVRLNEESVELLFRLLDPSERSIAPATLIGSYALEVTLDSADPADWQAGALPAESWKSIVKRTFEHLGPLLLQEHSYNLCPIALFESSSRIVDGPTPRITLLWPQETDFRRISPVFPHALRERTLASLGAGVAETATALALCPDPSTAQDALRSYTMAKMLLLLQPLHTDPDEEVAFQAKALLYQCLGTIDEKKRGLGLVGEEFGERWTVVSEVHQLCEYTRAELSAWLRRQVSRTQQDDGAK